MPCKSLGITDLQKRHTWLAFSATEVESELVVRQRSTFSYVHAYGSTHALQPQCVINMHKQCKPGTPPLP